jgi:putative ABC transport system permease protein
MLDDLALAFRSLRRRRGFAAAAIGTLALGIGASTAIFSVAYGIAFRPLPYPDAERLIRIYEAKPAEALVEHEVSVAAFQAWREGAPSIESAALFGRPGSRILAGSDSVAVTLLSVSPNFFDVLGIRPIIGPGFKPEKEYTGGPRTTRA